MVERLVIEPGRAPFVGRSREFEVLDALAARAALGDPQLVFIEGEPGVGKSRLLDEVAARRAADGWVTLQGAADDLPTAPPYGPFLAALRSYSDIHGVSAIRALAGDWAPHLATVLPELRAGSGTGRAGAGDAAAVAEAWAQVFRALAASGPMVVVLDDLQWADEASRELLRYLRRRLRGTPLLVVCADRGDAGVRGDDRPHVATELARARLATLLLLGPLDPESGRKLVEGLLGGNAGPRLVALAQREGEGDPYILEELVRGLADEGRIVRIEAAWELADDAPGGLPAGIRGALEARLASLDAGQRTILACASVVGSRFTAELVAVAAERPQGEVDATLAVAERRRFIRAGDGDLGFAHDKIREALYAGLAPTERRRAHECLVDILLASSASAAPADPMRVAHHALRGERPERAVEPLLAAGAAAAAAGAAIDAADQYTAAVEVLQAKGPPAVLAEALLRLGTALADAGRYDAALEALEACNRIARQAGGDPMVMAGSFERLAAVHLAREHPAAAEGSLIAALEVLDGPSADAGTPLRPASATRAGSGDVHLDARLRILLLLARLFTGVTGRLEEGARLAGEVRDLAAAGGDRRREAEALAVMGQAALHSGDFGTGRLHFDAAIALVDPVHDPGLVADTADGLARLWYWTAAFHRLDLVAEAELDAARRTGDPHRLGWPTFWLAQAALGLGDWPTARVRAAELVDLGTRLGARRLLGQGHELLGLTHYWTGEFAEACGEFETGLDQLRRIGPGTLVYYLGPYGLALLAAGRTAEAEAILAQLRILADAFPRGSSPRVQAYNVAARIALGLGRADPAMRDELLGAEGQFHWFPVALTQALLAIHVDRAHGDLAAAARYTALARVVLQDGGGTPHLASVAAIEAEVAARSGDSARATAFRRRADEIIRAKGASPIAAGTGRAVGTPGQPAPGGPLSPRELEVLARIVDGSTNREIAEALSISEKTAINHATHIYSKLGVSNRAAAVSWAVRNGVV